MTGVNFYNNIGGIKFDYNYGNAKNSSKSHIGNMLYVLLFVANTTKLM